MPEQANLGETPMPEESASTETEAQKELDRIADEAALRALKTQEQADRDHGIFSK